MRAYNMAMAMIFINCGFYLSVAMGAFGSSNPPGNAFSGIQSFINSEIQIGIIKLSGGDILLAIAILLITGTILFLNSRAFSSEGVAYAVFTGVFWLSIGVTDIILVNIDITGFGIFVAIYNVAAFLIFAIALVQMPTGGQKSHV